MTNIDQMLEIFINKLKENYIITDDLIKGCTEIELIMLEKNFNLKLPKLYRNFLSKMGHYAGGFWKDDYYSYNDLIGVRFDNCTLKDSLQDSINNSAFGNPIYKLPENSFVFWSDPTGIYYFFICEEGIENPKYYYSDGGNLPILSQNTFFDLLMYYADRCDRRWK